MNPGRLKNGNPSGDPTKAPRCGAHSRRTGQPCRAPAMKKKTRCRMHGGKSTGPKTPAGLAQARSANQKHGNYSLEARQIAQMVKVLIRECKKAAKSGMST